jgi:hypothetical protein
MLFAQWSSALSATNKTFRLLAHAVQGALIDDRVLKRKTNRSDSSRTDLVPLGAVGTYTHLSRCHVVGDVL